MTLRVHPLAAENHRPSLTLAQHSLAWLPGARSEDVAKATSGLKEYRRLRTMKASCSSSRLRPVPGIDDRL